MHAYRDGNAPGLERVRKLGVEPVVFPATGTSEDVAMLLADDKGASLIVAVGTHATLVEFLDKGRSGMASTFLTRLRVGGKLVDAKGVSRLYRSRISNLSLAVMLVVGLIALFVALWRHPRRPCLPAGHRCPLGRPLVLRRRNLHVIDFRYHLVSIVSIFLALAVGIVLGAGPLKEDIGNTLTSEVTKLREDRTQLRAELDEADKAAQARDTFTEESNKSLLAGRLQDTTLDRRGPAGRGRQPGQGHDRDAVPGRGQDRVHRHRPRYVGRPPKGCVPLHPR